MPCTLCGHWARRWRWFTVDHPTDEQVQSWWYYYRDSEFEGRYWCLHCVPTCKATAFLARYERIYARLLEEAIEVRALLEEAYDELDSAWLFLDQ